LFCAKKRFEQPSKTRAVVFFITREVKAINENPYAKNKNTKKCKHK